MEPYLEKILESTFTVSQMRHRVRILREHISRKLFNTSNTKQLELADLEWVNLLGKPFLDQFTKDNCDQIFKYLEDYLQNLKPLIIYFAFEPVKELNDQVGLMLRQNFTNHKVFDAKIDPGLVAGCALSFNGIYKDYSLRVRIAQEKEKIMQNFKKFLS